MKKSLIYFADYRAKLEDPNTLVIHAGTNETYMKDAIVKAKIDGVDTLVDIVYRDNNRARFCYRSENLLFSCEYQFLIPVPDKFKKLILEIEFSGENKGEKASFVISGKNYAMHLHQIAGCVDKVKKVDNIVKISGWCADAEIVQINMYHNGDPVLGEVRRLIRTDIEDYYLKDELSESAGFEITLEDYEHKTIDIIFESKNRKTRKYVNLEKEQDNESYTLREMFDLSYRYLKQRGLKALWHKILKKVFGYNVFDYNYWIKQRDPKEKELKEQQLYVFQQQPLFSIVVPVYRPRNDYFAEMIKSVLNQTYQNFELCLADGGGKGHTMKKIVDSVAKGDARVKYIELENNLGIAENTNAALALTTGDYIVLGDHDDILRPDALYECAKVLEEDESVDVIYTDEDKFDTFKKKRVLPHFKPDYNLDLLRNNNYICHLFVFSRELYYHVGGFRKEFDGSQDYDMILRCTEKANKIKHIPKILYTWRSHENSTAKDPGSKNYAFEAGIKAVQNHFERLGIEADVSPGDIQGHNIIEYKVIGNPKISIVIPNKDHIDDLDICLKSIIGRQDYDNYEIIIVENNSENDRTFAYYKEIQAQYDCVKVVYWNGELALSEEPRIKEPVEFNYSKINNAGVAVTTGEYVLLLNNDTEMIRKNCLREMVSYATRPEIGIVGARLLYNDNTLQHGGVIVGLGGIAGHAFAGVPKNFSGYFARAIVPQNYSAVTAACLMVRKSIYEEVNGFDEKLKVAFNDVDFCLKVGGQGHLIAYNPRAELYHYESKSRGYEDTAEKVVRFKDEMDYFFLKWKKFLEKGDPCYNINLSLTKSDFSLRE